MYGRCMCCGRLINLAGASMHVPACRGRIKALRGKRLHKTFIIRVSGEGFLIDERYWMIIEADQRIKLTDLDAFLRDVWVECCGHLSLFNIDYVEYCCEEYFVEPPEHGEKKMSSRRLSSVLYEGCEFTYEYDFGTTTELNLKVLREALGAEKHISILARNLPLKIPCLKCREREAKYFCAECFWSGERKPFLLCETCVKPHFKHEMPESAVHRIYNSPRVGACGPLNIQDAQAEEQSFESLIK